KPALKDADAVIGNLEVVAFGSAQNMNKTPRIGTSIQALNELKNLNLNLVTLATNHFYDNLKEGFENTITKLNELGISYVGSDIDSSKAKEPAILEVNGWRIGFINYVHPDTHPSLPNDVDVHTNFFNLEEIVDKIKGLKPKVDRVVALMHWGGKTDYGYFPHHEQLAQAKSIIEAGADALIGCHTHTFQVSEEINGKPVYYSLGNFCFADIQCDGGVYTVRNSGKKGGIVCVEFCEDGTVNHSVEPIANVNHEIVHIPHLAREFKMWNRLFRLARIIPGGYAVYYWALKRIEPVFYHAQLNGTTVAAIAWNKVLKLLRIR
ncbi:MAG: CapA family protein, partial [Flavobacteriales bacterium]|nr:CapA family protein [Flavobacteriales bacterium]